jgi:hypothetical protein
VCAVVLGTGTELDKRYNNICSGGALLVLTAAEEGEIDRLSLSEVVSVRDITNRFRAACLSTATKLTSRLLDLYMDLPAASEIWQPLLPLLDRIQRERLPKQLATDLERLKEAVEKLPQKRGALVKPAKQVL